MDDRQFPSDAVVIPRAAADYLAKHLRHHADGVEVIYEDSMKALFREWASNLDAGRWPTEVRQVWL